MKNEIHMKLVELSKKAHECYEDQTVVEELRTEMDKFYLKTLD